MEKKVLKRDKKGRTVIIKERLKRERNGAKRGNGGKRAEMNMFDAKRKDLSSRWIQKKKTLAQEDAR